MKAILRYTLGRVSRLGWTILFESVRFIKKIYPEFSIFVCYNKLSPKEVEKLKTLEVGLIRQDELIPCFAFSDSDEGRVRNFCWKLVPARINPNGHELWMDNDIILRDRIPKIDWWLSQKTSIISAGFYRDYGIFSDIVPSQKAFCAGFFGLPPYFDFAQEIKKHCEGISLQGFDEQGLTTLIVTSIENYITVTQEDLVLLSEHWRIKQDYVFPPGLHFARANRFDGHLGWKSYRTLVNV